MRNARLVRAVVTAVAFVMIGVVAACGDDASSDLPDQIVLAGTPIPAATPTTTPVPICDPPGGALPLPANFPPDVPVPPGFVVWAVRTEPFLQVQGRISPPPGGDPDSAGQIVGVAMVDNLQQNGWAVSENPDFPGSDYIFRKERREGHLNSSTVRECVYQAALLYDLLWVTP